MDQIRAYFLARLISNLNELVTQFFSVLFANDDLPSLLLCYCSHSYTLDAIEIFSNIMGSFICLLPRYLELG